MCTSSFTAYANPRRMRKSAERGFSRHAASSVWMYSPSASGKTECGLHVAAPAIAPLVEIKGAQVKSSLSFEESGD